MKTKKLIVTDLDGTALQNWEMLDPKTKEALIAAKEAGTHRRYRNRDVRHVHRYTFIRS